MNSYKRTVLHLLFRRESSVHVSYALLLHDSAYHTHHCFLNYNMQSKLERKLTRNERQAYEGAKDFYHIMIPLVIILTLGASINRSYSRTDKE